MAHVPPAHSDKEVIASTARRSQAAQVSKTGVVAETTKEERAGVPTSLVMVGAIASPVGAFLLLVLFQMGFSSWELLVYSYGLAVVTGILLLVIFPILGRVRKFRPVRANR
jgi:VIT1/CCC1 family predicted Fe2+/Mn2+ transporter